MAVSKQKQGLYPIVLLILFALLPLFKISTLVDHTLVPRQLLASVGTALLLLMILFSSPTKTLPLGLVSLSFGGFILMNFISVSAAINSVESWATISRYLLSFSFLITLIYLFHHKLITAQHLIKAVVLFGGLAAVITLFQLLKAVGSGEFFSNIYTVTGNFSHKNLLSSALMLSLPFAIMGASTLEKMWKKGSLILVFLLVIEMFVLRTRGVWLSVFIAAFTAFLVFMVIRKKPGLQASFPYKLVGLGAGIAVLLLVVLFSASGVQESVTDTTNLNKRLVFWNNSVEMIKENPAIGVGAGNWKINFPKYGLGGLDYNVVQGITHVQRPHDDYLWVLTESGPLGLIFFLGIFVAAFWYLSASFRKSASKTDMAIDLSITFGLIAYLVFSLTDFPLERTSHNLLVMGLIALIFRNGLPTSKLSVKTMPLMVVLLAGVVFSLVVSSYRWQGEKHSVEVLQANASRNAQRIVPAAEAAINPFYNMDNFANPVYYYSSLGKLVLKRTDEALQDALMAYDLAPYNIITLTQIGNVYKTKKDFDEAIKYYDLATDISPAFEVGRFSKAEIYLNRKEYVKAYEELNKINPYTSDPRFAQQMPFTIQQLVATRNEHNKYPGLMRFMSSKRLKTADDYVRAYREFVELGRKS